MNRVASGAVVGVTLAGVMLTATPAEAASLQSRAYSVIKAQKGDPYRYGAAGPNAFDCSGLIYYGYRKSGKTLGRTAQAQYNKSKHISKSSRRVGDLVFFGSTSNIYHVGVYAGSGKIWHAPRTGTRVRLEAIWTKNVHYGRY